MPARSRKEIASIVHRLGETVGAYPDTMEVGIWRDGSKPGDGLAPPFPDEVMEERMRRCIVIEVRIDGTGDPARLH